MNLEHESHRFFDLHLHSNRSDGVHSPRDVLQHAIRGGLDVIALTDHDLTLPFNHGTHVVDGQSIYVIAAAEMSGTHHGREFHLLVYFPGEVPAGFARFCTDQVKMRANRYNEAVNRLDLPGLEPAPAAAVEGRLSLTRLHLAQAIVASGHATSIDEAFAKYARYPNVPNFDLPFTQCIEVAREYGGLTSWAHPPRQAVIEFLPAFVAAGLQGLEGIRPGLQRTDRTFYKKQARKYGLYLTGGSDWHGWHQSAPVGLFRLTRSDLSDFLAALNTAA